MNFTSGWIAVLMAGLCLCQVQAKQPVFTQEAAAHQSLRLGWPLGVAGRTTLAEQRSVRDVQRLEKPPRPVRLHFVQQRSLPAGYTAQRDLEYARVGEKSLLLDVYYPLQLDEPRPLIVWIHGGAWRAGSKDNCPAIRLLEQGYVVASISYRLSHEAIFPAQIHDCKAAIRWLRAHAERFGLDPQRVGAWGSSAGGHLVSLLGTSCGVEELEGEHGDGDQSSCLQAVCNFFGPTDFLQMDAEALSSAPFRHDSPESPESRLIGGSIQEHPELVAKANPVTYVTAESPPFLIVHGDQDPLVPIHQSRLLADALQKAGAPVIFHTVQGAGHGFGNRPEVNQLVDDFFSEHLLKK